MDSVQLSSVAQSFLTLCDPMNRSTPGLPVHHQLPELTQTHAHRVNDAIHPLLPPSPPAPNPSPASGSFPVSQLFAWLGRFYSRLLQWKVDWTQLHRIKGRRLSKCWDELVEKYWRKLNERLVNLIRPSVLTNWCFLNLSQVVRLWKDTPQHVSRGKKI